MSSTTIANVTTVSAPLNQQIGSAGAGIPVDIGGDTTIDGDLNVTGDITFDGTVAATTAETVTDAAQPAITSVGILTGLNVQGLLQLKSYAKAAKPAATAVGQLIYVSDATGAHVTGSLCFSNAASGTANWIDVTTGIAVV